MAIKYVSFSCEGSPIDSSKCTTRWDDSIKCSIPISGVYEDVFYNLMIMEGDEGLINQWVNGNSGKVQVISKEQANQLGQAIVPPGTERVEDMRIGEGEPVTYVATEFDVDNPENLWVVKEN
jgi:hypothetical protein